MAVTVTNAMFDAACAAVAAPYGPLTRQSGVDLEAVPYVDQNTDVKYGVTSAIGVDFLISYRELTDAYLLEDALRTAHGSMAVVQDVKDLRSVLDKFFTKFGDTTIANFRLGDLGRLVRSYRIASDDSMLQRPTYHSQPPDTLTTSVSATVDASDPLKMTIIGTFTPKFRVSSMGMFLGDGFSTDYESVEHRFAQAGGYPVLFYTFDYRRQRVSTAEMIVGANAAVVDVQVSASATTATANTTSAVTYTVTIENKHGQDLGALNFDFNYDSGAVSINSNTATTGTTSDTGTAARLALTGLAVGASITWTIVFNTVATPTVGVMNWNVRHTYSPASGQPLFADNVTGATKTTADDLASGTFYVVAA